MEKINKLTLIILGATFLFSCKSDELPDCPEKELRALSFGFESDLLEWVTKGGQIELKDSAHFEMSEETAYTGLKSAKFTVSPDSYVNSGVRSELSFDQQIEEGDETYYEYSILIPKDYQDVSGIRAKDGAPNWQIIGQWHDQPDECIGQNWDDIAGNSPPVALNYNYLTKSDDEYLKLMADPGFNSIHGFDYAWDSVSTISLTYGEQTIAIAKVNKGEWIRIKFHIKWSTAQEGFIQAWVNNSDFTNGKVRGSNMLNKASHYFKFGLYRNPTISFTNSIYYDDLVIY